VKPPNGGRAEARPTADADAAAEVDDRPSLAILAYHKVGVQPPGWGSWFYVTPETFLEHLRLLKDDGWHVIDLETLLEGLANPSRFPERAVLLTFDDAYRSFRSVVVPLLARFGSSAVLFVPTDYIGGSNTFDFGDEPEEPICDWADLRELADRGVSIQSHGASHRALSALDPEEQAVEILRSKRALEDGLGVRVSMFAYPYGDAANAAPTVLDTLRRAGYRAGCLYGGGVTGWPPADPYVLPRIPIGADTNLRDVLPERRRR
jgi:peptidoglycan/xylan/chitin deacetylase (PgdA/CDA1 family)